MLQRYTQGEGRVSGRVEQIRLRGRMADYGAAAIAGWCAHWGVPWWRMPLGRADVGILFRPPAEVPPRAAPCPHVRLRMGACGGDRDNGGS